MRMPDGEKTYVRGASREVREASRQLRRNMTPAETKLWEALKGQQLAGLKFHRQHAVGPFILDFYCAAHKLVVGVDGGIHDVQVERDRARTAQLEAYGYNVIRFRNEEVLNSPVSVLRQIL